MYNSFNILDWAGKRPITFIKTHTTFQPISARHHPILDRLPASYTAVKFYSRPSFPKNAENEALVARFVEYLARQGPVVSLDAPPILDDHEDFPMPDLEGVTVARDAMTLVDNLAVQTESPLGPKP